MNNRLQWITFAAAKLSGIIAICLGFSQHRMLAIPAFALSAFLLGYTTYLTISEMKSIPDDVDDPQWIKIMKQND